MIRDEIAIRERAAIGARYKEHLEAYTEALDAVEKQYADELLGSFDPAARERLWIAVQVCRKMKQHFGSLASQGSLAQHQLSEIARLAR
jgi:hypothetical protein